MHGGSYVKFYDIHVCNNAENLLFSVYIFIILKLLYNLYKDYNWVSCQSTLLSAFSDVC